MWDPAWNLQLNDWRSWLGGICKDKHIKGGVGLGAAEPACLCDSWGTNQKRDWKRSTSLEHKAGIDDIKDIWEPVYREV